MAEWNRWPVYTMQKRVHIPFKQPNPYGNEGQLDYDLTLRDQRMLNNFSKIPRRTKLSLRNSLTRRYPAVPIPSVVTKSYNLKEDKDFIDLDLIDPLRDAAGVLSESMENGKLVNFKVDSAHKQMKQWEDDLNKRLKGKEIPKRYWEFPELEKGNIHQHCAHCVLHHLSCY